MKRETEKKSEGELKNGLKAVRTRLGLSQGELAGRAGVARQTVGGIEAALYAPSAAVALRLAKALGCRVEDLFWLEEENVTSLPVTLAQVGRPKDMRHDEERLLIGKVGQRWIGHSLHGERAFRSEMVPTDGLTRINDKEAGGQVSVQPLDSPEALGRTVLVAGCSPAISLWTRSAQRWHPGLRANWIHLNSTDALQALSNGEVHIAGLHLCDEGSEGDNVPFVREAMGEAGVTLINFGFWDEGLLVQSGNPKNLCHLTDLTRADVKIINREEGAGARMLFDGLLQQDNIPGDAIAGYAQIAQSHRAVAQAVRAGNADAGMGTAAMAHIYDLDFLPLRRVRFDLAVRKEYLQEDAVSQLFETLHHHSVRLQLQKLGGYDTTQTGEVVAQI